MLQQSLITFHWVFQAKCSAETIPSPKFLWDWVFLQSPSVNWILKKMFSIKIFQNIYWKRKKNYIELIVCGYYNVLENSPNKICTLIPLKLCFYNLMQSHVETQSYMYHKLLTKMMVQAKRIYILMIKVNKFFFFLVVFSKRNTKHVLHISTEL